ncbi:MAG: DUF4239 domain-containing protein [Candidatus Eremiobacteraeota bacterium]|nr:DUF4239 domain-containing protein [Candidatus Eremiobacteraeota bacterium]
MAPLPPALQAVLFIGILVLLSSAGVLLARRFAPQTILAEHNHLAGYVIAVVGVIYAVLLAFMAFAVWERFAQAEVRTYDEANNLVNLYRDVGPLPGGHQLRGEIITYTHRVIDDEWPKMRSGGESLRADAQLERIGSQIREMPVRNMMQQDLQSDALARLNTMLLYRDERLSMSADVLPRLIWVILLCGAAVTIGFTFLFGFQRLEPHLITTSLLAITIGLSLFLIYSIDAPFGRGVRIEPRPFERALQAYAVVGR